MNNKIIIGTLVGCFLGATVGYSASVVSLPHTFTAGTAIKASEVNANFSALVQEISTIKKTVNSNWSTNFTEVTITPINVGADSTITLDSTSFTIKHLTAIEDIITGKKYTLNYPVLSSIAATNTPVYKATNCNYLSEDRLVIREANHDNKFSSYVLVAGSNLSSPLASTSIFVQVSNALCVTLFLEQSTYSKQAINPLINRAVELQKYITVQEN